MVIRIKMVQKGESKITLDINGQLIFHKATQKDRMERGDFMLLEN
jgi:hypothetical protein